MDTNAPEPKSELANVASTGPYDSLREYIAALESHGYLLRIPEIDQDQYEATALAYRLVDRKGYNTAPAMCRRGLARPWLTAIHAGSPHAHRSAPIRPGTGLGCDTHPGAARPCDGNGGSAARSARLRRPRQRL